MKILAVTPTYGDKLVPEAAAMVRRQRIEGEIDYRIIDHNPYPAPDVRNVLEAYRWSWAECLAGQYHALLTVEHDVVLPDAEAVQRMAQTDGDVIYGVYVLRHGSNVLNTWERVGVRNLGESLTFKPDVVAAYRKAGFGPISGVGWGCTLIRRHVVEQMTVRADSDTSAGDIEFAQDVLRAGLRAVGRFDVACWHVEEGTWLHPYEQALNGVTVTALQTYNGRASNGLMRFVKGQEYEIDAASAREYARAGLVRIHETPAPEIAVATLPVGNETAAAAVGKRKRR